MRLVTFRDRAGALEHVFGCTLVNDVTAQEIHRVAVAIEPIGTRGNPVV